MPAHRSVLATLLLAAALPAQLPTGTYTIDPGLPPGGTNFTTWASAIAALSGGVSGPGNTTFVVASTTFPEVVSIPPISGTSAASTLTFVALGSRAIIDAGGAQDAFTITNNQSYLIFENLHIQNWTRYGINLAGTSALYCSFCTFKNVSVDGPASSSASIFALRNYYSRDCEFLDCVFEGGGYVLRSESTQRANYRRCRFGGKGVSTRLLAPFNTNDADNRWENCFFHDCGPTGNGLHIDLSSYGNMFWHNTIIVNTSGTGAFMGSCCAWTRANSFRNNIVINWGSGSCVTYGAAATGILDYSDLDHNVYYAPNGNAVRKENGVGFTLGTLAAWQAHHAANPGYIPAGGGTIWDDNSIEGDPGLVSAMAPYDIHLTSGSIAKDFGTTVYVIGPWISYPVTAFVANDFEGDPRPAALVDSGADEIVCPSPQWETNSPASSLDIDGNQGTACAAAISVKSAGSPTAVNFASTNVGLGFDTAVALAPLVPLGAGALVTGNGQIINMDLTAPTLLFLNGGPLPTFVVPFPGNFTFNFGAPTGPFTISAQMVVLDPGHPDGASLSQGVQLDVP
jgi:hypothetical protein